MILDRTTYEAWLLDRIEGKLTPHQEHELDVFLAANPDLDASVGELPSIQVGASAIDWKHELKKSFPPTGEPDASRLNEFLAARLEGDLDKQQEKALDKFLFEHPEHAQDAKRMAVSRVEQNAEAFQAKATIERHFPPLGLPDKHRLADFLIAAQEGDLSKEQSQALSEYLAAHPEAQREQRLIAAARVERERVVFFGKEQLKKKEGRVVVLWQRYAAAASIALLIGLAWWMMREKPVAEKELAKKEDVKPVVPPTPKAGTLPGKEDVFAVPLPKTVREGQGPVRENRMEKPPAVPQEQPAPVPQPSQDPIAPAPQQEPLLAQDSDPVQAPSPEPLQVPDVHVAETHASMAPVTAMQDGRSNGGTTIGALLANTVRDKVFETEERATGLDRDDAVAMVDKGVHAITGGQGGVDVQRTGTRDRFKLRLGRNLAISASRGR